MPFFLVVYGIIYPLLYKVKEEMSTKAHLTADARSAVKRMGADAARVFPTRGDRLKFLLRVLKKVFDDDIFLL